jgi:hypothetical protein
VTAISLVACAKALEKDGREKPPKNYLAARSPFVYAGMIAIALLERWMGACKSTLGLLQQLSTVRR